MKIAILNLTGGGLSGGYKKYLLNILPRMAGSADVESILCVSPAGLNIKDYFESLPKITFASCSPFSLVNNHSEIISEELEKFGPDIIFIPMERFVSFKKVPVVNMIQNMLPMVSIPGNTLMERARNYVQKQVAKRAVKRSQRVIAISEFVKEYIVNECSVSKERVGLAYLGVDLYAQAVEKPSAVPHEWTHNFLFTAGSIDPYRRLEDIFLAMKMLSEQNTNIKVVIAGNVRPAMHRYMRKLKKMASKLNVSTNICWTGNLDEREMSWCYLNCKAFIMSSRVEACPNTVLEALSTGCISITANNPPLPEFYKDTAFYYNSEDEKSLAQQILHTFNLSEYERAIISDRAKKRASEFSWDKTVEKTITELKKAISID